MRSATDEEAVGLEVVNRYLHDRKAQLKQSRGAKRYTNVEQEGPPVFPGDIPVQHGIDDEIAEAFEPSDDEPERENTPRTPPFRPEAVTAENIDQPPDIAMDVPPRESLSDSDIDLDVIDSEIGELQPQTPQHNVPSQYGPAMRPRTHTQQTLPYPPSSATANFYIGSEGIGETLSYLAEDAEACLQSGVFMLRKKRRGD